MLWQLLNHYSPCWVMSTSASFSLLELCTSSWPQHSPSDYVSSIWKEKLLWHQLSAHREGREKQGGLPGALEMVGLGREGGQEGWGWPWGRAPAVMQPLCAGVGVWQSLNTNPRAGLLQDFCGAMLLFCKSSLCWLLAFVGPLEAGAGHWCHNPGTAWRWAREVAAWETGGPSLCSERSGPKWLGQGRCWHVTGWGCWRSWSLFLSLLLLLFPLHFCLPTSPAPPHQPFVDTWSFTSSWHSQSLLRGL